MEDAAYILALTLVPGSGSVGVNTILATVKTMDDSLERLIGLPPEAIINALPPGSGEAAYTLSRCNPEIRARAEGLLGKVAEAGGHALPITDPLYPQAARTTLGKSAPPILFFLGPADLLSAPCGGVVGARRVSDQGRELAAQCAAAFARERIPVVSGGADGADTAAHGTALEQGGQTIVVLPQGLLTYAAPGELRGYIEAGNAVVVSQFTPDAPWSTQAAVTRNAFIAALALVLCVIEPKKTGGSIRTAKCAIGYGRHVLISGTGDEAATLNQLERMGAFQLIEPGHTFNPERILELWNTPLSSGETQPNLF